MVAHLLGDFFLLDYWFLKIVYGSVTICSMYGFICTVFQKAEAFSVVGKLSRTAWLFILGISAVFCGFVTYRLQPVQTPNILFLILALIASVVYLIEIKPKVQEITKGGHF